MLEDNAVESEVFKVNWAEVSTDERVRLLNLFSDYVASSRMAMVSVAGFNTNSRTLFVMMTLALALATLQIENKTIVASLLILQFAKTMLSKFVESKTIEASMESQEQLKNTLQKMAKIEV